MLVTFTLYCFCFTAYNGAGCREKEPKVAQNEVGGLTENDEEDMDFEFKEM